MVPVAGVFQKMARMVRDLSRKPFIFMNAVGQQRDVETILHEAGHAFHALATRGEDLLAYRGAPIEFCEVASMAMELLGNEFLEEFYSTPEANRARKTHLEGIIGFFPWMATVDAAEVRNRCGLTAAPTVASVIAFGSGTPASSASANHRANCANGSVARER